MLFTFSRHDKNSEIYDIPQNNVHNVCNFTEILKSYIFLSNLTCPKLSVSVCLNYKQTPYLVFSQNSPIQRPQRPLKPKKAYTNRQQKVRNPQTLLTRPQRRDEKAVKCGLRDPRPSPELFKRATRR